MTRTAPPEADPTPKEPAPAVALHTGTSDLRALITRNLRTSGIYVAFVAIVALFAILTDGVSLSPGNITNIVLQYSYILVLAIGMVLVIIAGHIDLSVGSVVALTGAVSAVLVIQQGMPWWVGILAAIAVGLLIGAWQGFWVAYVGIPAFIVTLAGMLTFRGLTQMVLGNVPITPFPPQYTDIGSGFLPDLGGGTSYVEPLTVVLGVLATAALVVQEIRERRKRVKLSLEDEPVAWFWVRVAFIVVFLLGITFVLASYRGTPIVLVILAVLVLIYTTVMNRSVFGRHVYARGGNLLAAQLSGVNTRQI